MGRKTSVARTVTAGCYGCAATWSANNGQGAAAAHHDKTGHATWARVDMFVQYGSAGGAAAVLQREHPGTFDAELLRANRQRIVTEMVESSPIIQAADTALRAARASMRLRPPRKVR